MPSSAEELALLDTDTVLDRAAEWLAANAGRSPMAAVLMTHRAAGAVTELVDQPGATA